MADYKIPLQIQGDLINRAKVFNEKELKNSPCFYRPDSRGKFTYLYRDWLDGSYECIGRLTYEGDMEKMDFAVYDRKSKRYVDWKKKYSFVKKYLNGTIEGAMIAGIKIFPIDPNSLIDVDEDLSVEMLEELIRFFS